MSENNIASAGNLALEKVLNGLASSANGIPATTGNVYYVIPTADSNYKEFFDKYQKTYQDGTLAVHSTIASAYADVTSNRNDIILLSANAAHAQTSMLTIAKNRVHFVGLSFRGGSLGMGARTRITLGVTSAATDLAVITNTGVGNTFTGIKFDSGNTKDESLYSVIEAGEYAIYRSCEIYKSTDLDETTAAELVQNGDSPQFIDCYIGSTANEVATAIIRPCVSFKAGIVSGKVSRDAIFKDCTFARLAGGTANAFVDCTGVNDIERFAKFKGCDFIAAELGFVPAEAVTSSGGKQGRGIIMLDNCTAWNCSLMREASVGIWVTGPVPTNISTGLAVE